MEFGFFDTLANAGLLLFWYRIWTGGDREVLFNHYMGPLHRISERALGFLRPVMFGLPLRATAAVALLFLIVFRGFVLHGVSAPEGAGWVMTLGFEGSVSDHHSLLIHMVVSGLSFAMFLFKVWGFSLVYAWGRSTYSSGHAQEAIHLAARPFSDAPSHLKPIFLLVFGMALALAVNLSGTPLQGSPGDISYWREAPVLSIILRFAISAMADWAGLLPTIRSLLLLLIIGSWVSMFASAGNLAFICREWLDTLLGPLRRFPIRIGMLDLTPLIFFFVLRFVYQFLIVTLSASYERLL